MKNRLPLTNAKSANASQRANVNQSKQQPHARTDTTSGGAAKFKGITCDAHRTPMRWHTLAELETACREMVSVGWVAHRYEPRLKVKGR